MVSFFGNLLVLIAFVRFRRVRSVTNYYVISLAVADLLVAVAISCGHQPWPLAVAISRGWPSRGRGHQLWPLAVAIIRGRPSRGHGRDSVSVGHVRRSATSFPALSLHELHPNAAVYRGPTQPGHPFFLSNPNAALHGIYSVSGCCYCGSVLGGGSTVDLRRWHDQSPCTDHHRLLLDHSHRHRSQSYHAFNTSEHIYRAPQIKWNVFIFIFIFILSTETKCGKPKVFNMTALHCSDRSRSFTTSGLSKYVLRARVFHYAPLCIYTTLC